MSTDIQSSLPNKKIEEEEEEEEEQDFDTSKFPSATTTWHLEDIEKLKEQTNSLLEPSWKENRNKSLLKKMLTLEHPTISLKMVDFLLQDNVIETLVSFITQNNSVGTRPGPSSPQTEEMKLAYKAVLILSPEQLSDSLNTILSKKTTNIVRKIFDIFKPDSAGSFYHAYRLFECLLRCYPAETFDALTSDGLLAERFSSMLRYIGFVPVAELIVLLVAFTVAPRNSSTYSITSKYRWIFLQQLNEWNLMNYLVLCLSNPTEYCDCSTNYVTIDQHATAASQLLQDLIEKVSIEESGDLLLLPFGTSLILDKLIDTMLNNNINHCCRRAAAKIVSFLLRRAAEQEIICFFTTSPKVPPQPTPVPNRLFAIREKIVLNTHDRIQEITQCLLNFDQDFSPEKDNIYFVKDSPQDTTETESSENNNSDDASKAPASNSSTPLKPFTILRQLILEVLVLTIESDDTVASLVPLDLYKLLISWIMRYYTNNVYHSIFYRILFAILRQGQEASQRILFQKAKFSSFLIDNFISNYSIEEKRALNKKIKNNTYTPAELLKFKRYSIRGLILNCANAIRFQANHESPSSFLNNFLNSHPKWNSDFLPLLTTATEAQLYFGMGIKISKFEFKNGEPSLVEDFKVVLSSVDHNLKYAKSLGFFEDAPWSLTPNNSGGNSGNNSFGPIVDDEFIDELGFNSSRTSSTNLYSEDSGRFSYLDNDSYSETNSPSKYDNDSLNSSNNLKKDAEDALLLTPMEALRLAALAGEGNDDSMVIDNGDIQYEHNVDEEKDENKMEQDDVDTQSTEINQEN